MNAFKNMLIKFNINLNLSLIMNLTIIFLMAYFLKISESNTNWINEYSTIFYLSAVFFIYFLMFAILYLFKTKYTEVRYKIVFQHLNIILLPLVICFAITISYFLCLTICKYSKIFYSPESFCHYLLISIFFLIGPIVMVSQTKYVIRAIIDMVTPGLIAESF